MNNRNAIVIVVDRFGAGYLGPYGNTWIETPTLNRLASESLLWENVYADCPTLDGFYRAVDQGQHAWNSSPTPPGGSLIERITAAGVHSMLVTDEEELAQLPFSGAFRERLSLPATTVEAAADSIAATQMAQVMATALDCLDHARSPFLLWVHLRGMSGAWDAPHDYRASLADEEDPPPPDFVDPPHRVLSEQADPDEILGISQAYAGQVLLLDTCLSPLLQSAGTGDGDQNTLLMLTSPRGCPLGEHGGLGSPGDGLFEEVLHLPLLVRHPQRRNAMERFQGLVQPGDLHFTLHNWFQLGQQRDAPDGFDLLSLAERNEPLRRQCVASVFGDQRSLRTMAWFLRKSGDQPPSLYVKPADRWEVNEIAVRCGDVVDEAMRALTAYEHWMHSNRTSSYPELPSGLLHPEE